MVISLNSFAGFTSTANHHNIPRVCIGASIPKTKHFFTTIKYGKPLLVANSDRITTETSEKTSDIINQPPPTSETEKLKNTLEPSEPKQETANANTNTSPKRLKLTAREKLKAARVRNRDTESKPVKKPELGSTVLEALRETDRMTGRKRSGLPEAPTNLLDDSKRGMPKKGLTFELPVGWDVFLIITSVVVISTIMFTTTYVVWKVGAIHFNEY